MYCKNCGAQLPSGAYVCAQCGVPVGQGDTYCANCGQQTDPLAVVCVHCGASTKQPYPPQYQSAPPYAQQKSKIAAGLLGIFLGSLGVHNFYLGYTTKAIIQILLCTVGSILTCGIGAIAAGIWGLVEGILILAGSITCDANGVPLSN